MKDPRASRLSVLYNLTPIEWEIIAAYQNHVCFVCGQPNKSGKRLSTDHSHITGLIRGLLCQRCNRIFGKIEDPRFWRDETVARLLRLAEYIQHPPAVAALGREVYTYPGKFGTKAHKKYLEALRNANKITAQTVPLIEGISNERTPRSPSSTRRKQAKRQVPAINQMRGMQAHRRRSRPVS